MTVYVDTMKREAMIGRRLAVWSHLMADTSEELHAFAARLGLRPAWVQHPDTPHEHYDVTDVRRSVAVRLGAVPIIYPRESGALVEAKRRGVPFDLAALRASTEVK